ncbi:hypothetical protein [Acinetobacter dispersus]|uniref:Uncharacterized protein n=1 Tax=Acinetobacter dispersus TaxID=70348 RepID=N9L803_9GAMM|nr:hypothetical protein [Acinetobacter dispersus]ENW92417.1 hypothetical protein F904_02356 [Acinetobacter dispersus]
MARANTKIGDVFSVKLDDGSKKYFQLIAFDLTQLNSDVIRAFNKVYSPNDNPDFLEVVSGEIDFYVHCVTKFGLKMNLWEKVGNIPEIGDTSHILFRDTNDYGNNVGGEEVKVSHNWHVWRINDENFTPVGRLERENRHSYIGLVINPLGVIELLKGNKYPLNYPDYQ